MSEMPEILFRGKRVDNGEWAYGYYVNCAHPRGPENETRHYIISYPGGVKDYHEIYTSTVGRYTGLTDKNGVKIFEEDILHFINTYRRMNTEWLCIVEFLDGAFICRYVEKDGHIGEYNYFDRWNAPAVQWDIIGNIHDNPELLEGGGEA